MEEETKLNLRDFTRILKKRIKLIFFITILTTAIAGALSLYVIKPTYQATATIIAGKEKAGSGSDSTYDFNDVMMYQNLIRTYAQIGKSNAVAESATAGLNGITAEEIEGSLTVTPQTDTQIVQFSVQNGNPQKAYIILNAVCNSFIQEIHNVYPGQNTQIVDRAKVPTSPVKPRKRLNIAIGFFIGLMASVGLAVLLEYMDNTIKTEGDISNYLGLPVIGMIPKDAEKY